MTVPISKQDNVATFYSVSGYMKLKMSKKSDQVAKQVLLSRSKDEGMYCEVLINEVKLRRYWLVGSIRPAHIKEASRHRGEVRR